MDMFRTRSAGDAGLKLDLFDPATGDDTEHWLCIHSVDSEAFELADTIARRRTGEIQRLEKEEEKAALVNEITRNLLASLVISWSFDIPCTREAVVDFLRTAPQIANAINTMSGQRALFMKSNSPDSTDTLNPPSNSTPSPTEAVAAEEAT